MAYTRFGEFVRILRIKHHEVMGDMAKVLGASLPFLSSVENGKKNVPADWTDKITAHYCLTPSERQELNEAVEESKIQYKIPTQNAGYNQRKAAMQFARSFDKMDDETAMKILELLSKKDEENQ
ncbi:MAG: helix-turn-helix domain-containing protein [Lachnospiraceae bacterium]|nr:helix-turn-helix domain-containing protein [Lachnospiraceae bacterium]